MVRLDGKVAIVTGAGRGIGRAEARELARRGARVVVNDVDPVAEEVAREIEAEGGAVLASTLDASSFEAAEALVATALDAFGGLDVVVNNAGVLRVGPIAETTMESWEQVVRVNLHLTFAVTRHAAAHWRKLAEAGEPVGGRVVNTTSGSGLRANPGAASYSATKAAVAAFTLVAAQELRPYGVTVNAVAPQARTRMSEAVADIPAAGEGDDPMAPDNVAAVVAYLASDEAHWLTGQVIHAGAGKVGIYRGWRLEEAVERTALAADEVGHLLMGLYGSAPTGAYHDFSQPR